MILPLLFSSFLFLYFLTLFFSKFPKSPKLSPGPKSWPILGNLLHLFSTPHRSLARLSTTHGPLMSLHLGTVFTVVVSSSNTARQLYQNHDLAFSSRRPSLAVHSLDHHNHSVVFLPVSPKWWTLRKISATQLFTKKRLDATELLRQRKLEELLDHVGECCRNGEAVEIASVVFTTTLNLLSNAFFSVDLADFRDASSGRGLKDLVGEIMEAAGKPNLVDYFPVLAFLDVLGVERRMGTYFRKFFDIFDGFIEQRLSGVCVEEDVLAALLKINREGDSDLCMDDIRNLILDLFIAGTDTISSTFEWAMTELLCNPTKMAKAQAELDEILGNANKIVKESDITKIPYLQAIVKETLRLHPPSPLLIPHKAEIDVDDLCGYVVPRNTQLLVNVWAINRDPDTWKNPEDFLPERFLESEIDFGGNNFEYLPFGAGRRMCPGVPLATRMLHMFAG